MQFITVEAKLEKLSKQVKELFQRVSQAEKNQVCKAKKKPQEKID